ncbi:MAG TPA: response regulator, partial [Caulobacterales bacterium]|nr:response regulator [Caulobacterales bacterium]
IERQLPDVVVTDVVMPGHDALEFLPLLRARFPHLPVVVVSGGGQTGAGLYLDIARKLGADECLPKPFTPEALSAAIERAFRRNAE